jgi:hypothetical protein
MRAFLTFLFCFVALSICVLLKILLTVGEDGAKNETLN